MVDDRSNHIGPVETVAAPAVIVLKVVVELEGLPALQRHRAVQAPAVFQTLPVATHGWQVVSKNPGKPVRYVEVGRTVLELRPGAVVRLRRVGFKIVAVTRIVQRLRPNIIRARRDAVPSVHSVTG